MPNNSSLPYPIPSPSLFASQKLFVGFSPKAASSYSDSPMSPTSTLETKLFSPNTTPKKQRGPPIGLGLIDVLNDDDNNNNEKRFFFFGSQLKIQVPPPPPPPRSPPIEFGVKTKDSQLALVPRSPSPLPSPLPCSFSPEFLTDMELSEDYTCVISHGPNPKTTHIFDNCVVESCGGEFGFLSSRRKENELPSDRFGCSADGFLSFCHACKRNLSEGKDVFMYRGEKAFCSEECRRREMLFDEGREQFAQNLSALL